MGTAFKLTERAYAHDSLKVHHLLRTAAAQGIPIEQHLSDCLENGHTLNLPEGTEIVLAGRGSGFASEALVSGCPGLYVLDNAALERAGIAIPPTDYAWVAEQIRLTEE